MRQTSDVIINLSNFAAYVWGFFAIHRATQSYPWSRLAAILMSRFMLRLRQVVHSADTIIPAGQAPRPFMGNLGEWINEESDTSSDEEITFAVRSTSAQSSARPSIESYAEVEN